MAVVTELVADLTNLPDKITATGCHKIPAMRTQFSPVKVRGRWPYSPTKSSLLCSFNNLGWLGRGLSPNRPKNSGFENGSDCWSLLESTHGGSRGTHNYIIPKAQIWKLIHWARTCRLMIEASRGEGEWWCRQVHMGGIPRCISLRLPSLQFLSSTGTCQAVIAFCWRYNARRKLGCLHGRGAIFEH